jgi:hypothetical protein
MPSPGRGVALALAMGTAITLAIAWPVVRHPTELIFGHEIVGRHAARYARPIDDLASYSARWWASFVPPVDHPYLGVLAQRS